MILYSTNCPNCKALKQLLDKRNIKYTEENDINKMIELGFDKVPVLEDPNGNHYEFNDAIKYIESL